VTENRTKEFVALLKSQAARDPAVLAKALAVVRKTPLQDQVLAAKNGWGFLAENLDAAQADAFSISLRQAGVENVVCPASFLATLPVAQEASTFKMLTEAPPVLIAAAAITVTSTTTKQVKEGPSAAQKVLSTAILLGTGLPIKIGGKDRIVEKTQQQSDMVFYVDVIYGNPSRRLRVNSQNFDYSFLKERKLYQVFGNFKLLLGDLTKATPTAWTNHGTRVLLEGKPIQTMGYGSLADLERETRWLLTLQTLGSHGQR
jgi:hypothetical protein